MYPSIKEVVPRHDQTPFVVFENTGNEGLNMNQCSISAYFSKPGIWMSSSVSELPSIRLGGTAVPISTRNIYAKCKEGSTAGAFQANPANEHLQYFSREAAKKEKEETAAASSREQKAAARFRGDGFLRGSAHRLDLRVQTTQVHVCPKGRKERFSLPASFQSNKSAMI